MKLVEISKKEEYYNGEIYDLTVIDDSSYCVENTPVHNCGCITSSNTGIHYPMASLIHDTYEVKKRIYNKPKIIADGGIRNYSDVIKALALGADYVMIGSVFASLVESAAPTFYYLSDRESIREIDPFEHKIDAYPDGQFDIDESRLIDNLHKVFYGMASRRGQEDINGEKTKTSEGIEKILPATTNLRKWKENMVAYMQSAMSYTDTFNITDFNPEYIKCLVISNQSKESINK